MRTFPAFIAGEWLPGHRLHTIVAPWDGEPVGAVHVASAAQVELAIAAGKRAQPAMAALPAWRRHAILQRVAHSLRSQQTAFAELICREAGKPISLAQAEVQRAIDTFLVSAEEAGRLGGDGLDLGSAAPGEGRWGLVRRFPVGLISAITPFNFPLNLVAHKIAPAIAAGCPVVLKPSHQAPLSAFALAELIAEAGLPEGGLNVVYCDVADAEPLVVDARIQLLTFTGSAEVGWQLQALAGRKRVLLELGGNAACIVCPDADLVLAAARIAAGGFGFAGQSCISVQRVLVHRSRMAELREALDQAAARVGVGDPNDPAVSCGPLIDGKSADRLQQWYDEAQSAGAALIYGGGRSGNLMQPAIFADVPHHARLVAQEAFGPVVVLAAFDDLDDALHQANDSRYGLQAGVFTDSVSTLWRCFEGLEVGGVIHNDVPTFRVDAMPYGGIKDSGRGREGPRQVVLEYTEPRMLALRPEPR
jgi:glyceraldehyde-3-phosphate dehydrogenase (NADP+)